MPANRLLASTLALALAAALAGCGGDGDEERVRATLDALATATAAKDYQRLCDDVLAGSLIAELRSVGLPCELALRKGLEDVRRPRLEVGRVRVRGDRAFASVRTSAAGQRPSTDTVELVKEDDDWRVASLAGAGPPTP